MSKNTLGGLVSHLRRLVSPWPAEKTDQWLLAQFLANHDEAAFAALLGRHGPMVFGVSKHLLSSTEDAEDVVQATFLILARKAGSIRKRASLASWLYGVAQRLSGQLKRQQMKRQRRENKSSQARGEVEPPKLTGEFSEMLDAALQRLPEKFRDAIIVCQLEGKSQEEAAKQLGCPVGTVQSRLARGRKLLQKHLADSGLTLSAAGLVTFLTAQPAPAALPAKLFGAALSAGVQYGSGKALAGLVSGSVAALVNAGLKSVALTKALWISTTVLALGLVAGGAGLASRKVEAETQEVKTSEKIASTTPADKSDDAPVIAGLVVDPQGQPAAVTTVWLTRGNFFEDGRVLAKTTTDTQGRFVFPGVTKEELFGPKAGSPQLFARDRQGRLGWIGQIREETLTQAKIKIKLLDIADVRGRVIDAMGNPLAKAHITPLLLISHTALGSPGEYAILFPEVTKDYLAETADDGSFVLRKLPAGGRITAHVSAPGFGMPRVNWDSTNPVTIKLERAAGIRGTTVSKGLGKASGVNLYLHGGDDTKKDDSIFRNYFAETQSAEDGLFKFKDVPPGQYTITPKPKANTPFYAETTAPFVVKPGEALQDITIPLHPAVAVRGRVIDEVSGKGIKDAGVIIYHLSDLNHLIQRSHVTTDGDGNYSAYVKPERITVSITQPPEGYLAPFGTTYPKVDAQKDTEFPDIKLEQAASLAGVVVDQIGKPVPGAKVYIVVQESRGTDWGRGPAAVSDKSGEFMLKGLDPTDTLPLRAQTDASTTDGAVVVVPSEQKGPVRLVVSPRNAFRVRGTVTNESGSPIPEAIVALEWHRSIVSKHSTGSARGGVFQQYITGADGIFQSTALWPGDQYRVRISSEGYSDAESIVVIGKAGGIHDFGRMVLIRGGTTLSGRVVDSAGSPVAGVRVFNSSDAPGAVSARTDAAGKFRLENLYAGPVTIFGQKEGFRFTGMQVRSDGSAVTMKILSKEEIPSTAKEPRTEPSWEEQRQVARSMLERLWALPAEKKKPVLREIVESMTRLDIAQGLRWAEQAGPRYLGYARLIAAERLAETDPAESVAMLANVGNYSASWTYRDLGKKLLKSSPAKALLFVEEGVVRARALEQPERTFMLASLGSLVRQLGKEEAGRKLIEEAATPAATMGKGQELALALTAEALAAYDLPRALKLLDPITEQHSRDRWLGRLAVALAPQDLERALEFPKKFSKTRTTPDRVRTAIAYLVAPSQPAKAIEIAESCDSFAAREMKADTLSWIAVAVAPKDKKLAYELIDRSMLIFEQDSVNFRTFTGGPSMKAARVFGIARQIGYPDLESLAYRVLAMVPSNQDDTPARVVEHSVATALVLALAEPALAKQILSRIESRSNLIGSLWSAVREEHWLQAWALADPKHALELFEKHLNENPKASLEGSGLAEMVTILSVAPQDRPHHLLRFFGHFWFPGEE